jgi:hypothetical protein
LQGQPARATDKKKPPSQVAFCFWRRITSWPAQQQEQRREQQQPVREQQRQQPVREQQEQQPEQRREPEQREQQLLLFYHKRPKQQQRSRLPEREFCSC